MLGTCSVEQSKTSSFIAELLRSFKSILSLQGAVFKPLHQVTWEECVLKPESTPGSILVCGGSRHSTREHQPSTGGNSSSCREAAQPSAEVVGSMGALDHASPRMQCSCLGGVGSCRPRSLQRARVPLGSDFRFLRSEQPNCPRTTCLYSVCLSGPVPHLFACSTSLWDFRDTKTHPSHVGCASF